MESHLDVNKRLGLFFIDEVSPGSIFWLPKGMILYNNLIKIIRDLYDIYGYTEVGSPNICKKSLWVTSGHWQMYKKDMFILEDHHHTNNELDNDTINLTELVENENIETTITTEEKEDTWSLKPMSCPLHCLIFRNMRPYSKDLPIRLAEFAVLHRNETSGSLHGLTRVKRFQQDDSHIFCRFDQIQEEVMNTLRMIERVYGLFNLKFTMKLSTRPEKYIGTLEQWDQAEKILEDVIKQFSGKNKVKKNLGDGAFYGPKIDITLIDKYKRTVQCGTVQLDFNLPSEERFNLEYIDEHDQSKNRPVIVHRAVLGSVERFIGIILEHTQGRLPIQVSPFPIIIITVHKDYNQTANDLRNYIHSSLIKRNVKLLVDIDDSTEDIKNKVRSAEKKGYCYILTVGRDEDACIQQDITTAMIAVRKNKVITKYSLNDIINELEDGTRLI